MTKWDTIQADIADAYIYLDEEMAYEEMRSEFGDEIADDDLTLDWRD